MLAAVEKPHLLSLGRRRRKMMDPHVKIPIPIPKPAARRRKEH